jgi:hypothetical protein
MDPNEHLVEQYVRIVKKWFTMTNITLGKNHEIDILAIDVSGNAYQIEVDIHKGGLQWGPCGSDGYTIEQYKQRKFNKETKDFIRKTFKVKKSIDIWVCWGIDPKRRESTLKKAAKAKIEIWEFKDRIKELLDEIGTKHYSDDITQSLSLVKAANLL